MLLFINSSSIQIWFDPLISSCEIFHLVLIFLLKTASIVNLKCMNITFRVYDTKIQSFVIFIRLQVILLARFIILQCFLETVNMENLVYQLVLRSSQLKPLQMKLRVHNFVLCQVCQLLKINR